jgi:hypothetical protein
MKRKYESALKMHLDTPFSELPPSNTGTGIGKSSTPAAWQSTELRIGGGVGGSLPTFHCQPREAVRKLPCSRDTATAGVQGELVDCYRQPAWSCKTNNTLRHNRNRLYRDCHTQPR